MTDHSQLFDAAWLDALGWTLLHSIWQGAAISILLGISLLLFRKKSANIRYFFGVFALSGLLISMLVTFSVVYSTAPETEPLITPESSIEYADLGTPNTPIQYALVDETNDEFSLSSVFISYFEEHMPFILLLYLIGVLILTMRMLGELVYIQNLRYSRSQFVAEEWQQKLKGLAIKMGIKTPVFIKESIQVNSPMIIGFLKPIVFLPIGLLANLPAIQIESILAHELAHVRRHDYLINLLQSFVEIVLFFNPSVWWISSFIRSEREHCCDDIAIEMTGDELTFARTLANLEDWRIQSRSLAVAFGGNRSSSVLKRVQRLLEKEESIQLPFRLFWGATILAVGLIFTAFNVSEVSTIKNHLNVNSEPIDILNNSIENEFLNTRELFSNQSKNNEEIINLEEDIISEIVAVAQEENSSPAILNHQINGFKNSKLISSTIKDTVPNNIKSLEREMREIERNFKLQREELAVQMKDIQSKRYAIEKAVQKQNHELQLVQLEMQREMQNIEKEKLMIERELDLQQNNQEELIMELQFKMQELELLMEIKNQELEANENDEKIKKEIENIRKQFQELRKDVLIKEKETSKKEFEAKKQAILKEKEIQDKLYKNQLLEHENQMNAHSNEADVLLLEEAMQAIEIQMEELENEFHIKLYKKQQELENEFQKIEKEEY